MDYYVGRVGSRQLFSGQMYTQEGAPRISKALDKVDISDFTLIGIMGGDSPEAIVESKKEQKSYYLKKGDLVGPFQVKEIKEGQVILQRDSELLELNL